MIGAVSYVLPHWKLRRGPHSFGNRNVRCMSVWLTPSPSFKVLHVTANRAISLAKVSYRRSPVYTVCEVSCVR